jgi:hypothetical protein
LHALFRQAIFQNRGISKDYWYYVSYSEAFADRVFGKVGIATGNRRPDPTLAKMKRYLLCGGEKKRLARSHIFALNLFRGLPSKAKVNSIATSKGAGRKLQSVLYDHDIICDEYEHNIMCPLDDYGIQVIRDRKGAIRTPLPDKSPKSLFVFEGVDKCRIRAFLASVLWRCSVSKRIEVRDISIGSAYENRIRQDLLNFGDFAYVDRVLFYLTYPLHGAFLLPVRKRLKPLDSNRDHQMVSGWVLEFPNISVMVLLDKRPHPHRMFLSLDPDLTGREDPLPASSCLKLEADEYNLLALESQMQRNHILHILQAMQRRRLGPYNKPTQATRYSRA